MNVRIDMRNEATPNGVKMLYKLIRNAYNNLPIIPVKPQYIFSTDDTVVYAFEGLGTKEEKFRLVSVKSKRNAGSRSVYNLDENKAMNGLRVKLTFTFSAIVPVLQYLCLFVVFLIEIFQMIGVLFSK